MTMNPYAAPGSDAAVAPGGPAPPPRSFARRTSFVLAGVGFVVFWGAAFFAASNAEGGGPTNRAEIAVGSAVILAIVAHLVGIGVVFAAPRGRRFIPGLVNALSLVLMVALTIYGMTKGTPA